MVREVKTAVRVRALCAGDRAEVERIDRGHRGRAEPGYWEPVFARFLAGGDGSAGTVGFGAEAADGRLLGFLLAEVRDFEFGSEPCGWVFAVGVDPAAERTGVGSALLRAALRTLADRGVTHVRTMVARTDVPLQAFFRAAGFAGGPFVELELALPAGAVS